MCREEAQSLSSLVPFLDEHGVNLYAVVHEVLGTEEFKGFFSGEVFLDPEKIFYGPKRRWASLATLLNPIVWMNICRAKRKGVTGNTVGEVVYLGSFCYWSRRTGHPFGPQGEQIW